MKGSHHVLTTKLTLFAVRKDKWGTKEDAGMPAFLQSGSNQSGEMTCRREVLRLCTGTLS